MTTLTAQQKKNNKDLLTGRKKIHLYQVAGIGVLCGKESATTIPMPEQHYGDTLENNKMLCQDCFKIWQTKFRGV